MMNVADMTDEELIAYHAEQTKLSSLKDGSQTVRKILLKVRPCV